MSANVTTTAPVNPPSNGLKGIAPAVFNGTQSCAENFLNEFWRYKLLNCTSDTMNIPFYGILTALLYIHGLIVEDWVNTQDRWLEGQIDVTKPNHVAETDEVWWTEFKANFKSAWKDKAKAQSAYNLLMKLEMENLNVDMYIATFKQLAATAEWESDAKGTITCFHVGLQENVHCQILNHENMPVTMDQWKEVARKEVNQIR